MRCLIMLARILKVESSTAPKFETMSTTPVTWDTHWARNWRLAWDYVLGSVLVGLLVVCGVRSPGNAEDLKRRRSIHKSNGHRRRNSFESHEMSRGRSPNARSPKSRRRETSDPDVDCSD